jgi:hypothetical protein
MTLQQTVTIPADRRIVIDVPETFSSSRVSVILRDLLHVTPRNTVFPAPASSDAEYLKRKAREAHDIELINRDAEWLNAEALDVLSYQDIDL